MNFGFLVRSACKLALMAALGMPLVYSRVGAADPDPLVGLWRTPADPKTGEWTVVELFLHEQRLSGRVVDQFGADGRPLARTCDKCRGDLKGRAIAGMVFIEGLSKEKARWVEGRIVDLRDGLTQGVRGTVEIELVHGKAVVHGYKGLRILGETSTWSRYP